MSSIRHFSKVKSSSREFSYVKSNLIQNSPAVKNVCGPKKAIVKKDVKSKVAAKKWL